MVSLSTTLPVALAAGAGALAGAFVGAAAGGVGALVGAPVGAVVGALVARVWGLAPSLVTAIRLHHDLNALGDDSIEPEVLTLVAAGLVAEQLMRRHEALEPESDWVAHAPQALDWLQLSGEELLLWEEQLFPLYDDL